MQQGSPETFERILRLTFAITVFFLIATYSLKYLTGKSLEEILSTAAPGIYYTVFHFTLMTFYSEKVLKFKSLEPLHVAARAYGPFLLNVAISFVTIESELVLSPDTYKTTFS